MESPKKRKYWYPSTRSEGWNDGVIAGGTAKEALQYCLAQKWPWFVLENCWESYVRWPHSVFISTEILAEYDGDVQVDGERVHKRWGACEELDSRWIAGTFNGYRQCDVNSKEIQTALPQLIKLNIPKQEPTLQYYEFTCTEEEYDPQRVIREAVEDGRLWVWVPEIDRGANIPHVVIVRNDFAVPKIDAILGPFTEEWNSCCCNLNFKIPGGYRCYWVHRLNEQKVLDILSKQLPPPKKTYRVYYHGGK